MPFRAFRQAPSCSGRRSHRSRRGCSSSLLCSAEFASGAIAPLLRCLAAGFPGPGSGILPLQRPRGRLPAAAVRPLPASVGVNCDRSRSSLKQSCSLSHGPLPPFLAGWIIVNEFSGIFARVGYRVFEPVQLAEDQAFRVTRRMKTARGKPRAHADVCGMSGMLFF